MKTSKNVIEKTKEETENNIHQGDCVYLKNQDELFQVLGCLLYTSDAADE